MTQTVDAQARRMQAALNPVLQAGPDFLEGRRDAVAMANTMVAAVQGFVDGEKAIQSGTTTPDAVPGADSRFSAGELQQALAEVYTCGSGFLADRCDAACVARTMTYLVGEFGKA